MVKVYYLYKGFWPNFLAFFGFKPKKEPCLIADSSDFIEETKRQWKLIYNETFKAGTTFQEITISIRYKGYEVKLIININFRNLVNMFYCSVDILPFINHGPVELLNQIFIESTIEGWLIDIQRGIEKI